MNTEYAELTKQERKDYLNRKKLNSQVYRKTGSSIGQYWIKEQRQCILNELNDKDIKNDDSFEEVWRKIKGE